MKIETRYVVRHRPTTTVRPDALDTFGQYGHVVEGSLEELADKYGKEYVTMMAIRAVNMDNQTVVRASLDREQRKG